MNTTIIFNEIDILINAKVQKLLSKRDNTDKNIYQTVYFTFLYLLKHYFFFNVIYILYFRDSLNKYSIRKN